jgi:3-hydroxyacyl-[acyl-carrier-protein] dehydratase
MELKEIIPLLPYQKPFLFVDEISEANENELFGNYTFREDEYFYQGHFPDYPVTPGVILIETMAQIGLVAFGFFLLKDKFDQSPKFAFTSNNTEFYLPVLPGQKVYVHSKKVYFRLNKLKCLVEMKDEHNNLISRGELSGMILRKG